MTKDDQSDETVSKPTEEQAKKLEAKKKLAKELGGRDGPEPTRYGDWESKGIASDF